MASDPIANELPERSIELVDNDDEWFVRVVANGCETVNTFSTARFAYKYAEEQRVTLGVEEVQQV